MSRVFQCLLWIVGGLTTLGIIIFAAFGAPGIGVDHGSFVMGPAPGSTTLIPLTALNRWQRVAGSISLGGRIVPALVVLGCLRRIFALYALGYVFSSDIVKQYKLLGIALTIYAIIPIPLHTLAWLASLTPVAISIGSRQIEVLLLGAAVVIVSHVMEIGREIEQDQSEIV